MKQCLLRLRPGDVLITNADVPSSWMCTRFEILSLPSESAAEPAGVLVQARVMSRGDGTILPSDGKSDMKFIQFRDHGMTRRVIRRLVK